jgi:hypothetical protein
MTLPHQRGGQTAAATHRRACRLFDGSVTPLIVTLRGQGLSLQQIADELNRRQIPSRFGRRWYSRQVLRVVSRAQEAPFLDFDDARLGIRRR